jgi:Ca-activated chloride channel family protein
MDFWNKITFANPELFYFLMVLIPMIVYYYFKQSSLRPSIRFSNIEIFEQMPRSYKYYLRHLLFALRIFAVALLIFALARPQSSDNWKKETTEGIDIILALDISSSMLAEDLRPNRLEAAKNVAINFISDRELDRMGLVVFSGESFTQCPLTNDHAILINLLKNVESGIIEDGTAIGMGLANAVNRLKDSEALSKVVILLTDGENNRGDVAPLSAADIARTFGIRVYTIGVGTIGTAPYPFQTPFGIQYQQVEVKIDEKTLKEISQITDGKYFRATSTKSLTEIYQEIDKLEKSKIDVKEFSNIKEEFFIFAFIGFFILILEIVLKNTILRSIP